MLLNLKAMIVVLAVAMTVFVLAKPTSLKFMSESDFKRRRNVWLLLTLTAFASPSFWIYVAVALPVLAWAGRKDSNPIALYVIVMQVIPTNVSVDIPSVLVKHFFELTNYRILSFAILVPTALRVIQVGRRRESNALVAMDWLLFGYIVWQLVSLMPYESITNTMRRAFLLVLDISLLFFVVSRTCVSRKAIVETMAAFSLTCAIYAPLAVFERLKHWLLYPNLGTLWGSPDQFAYLYRDEALRAQVSTGQSIYLGFTLALGFGFWLYLHTQVKSALLKKLFPIAMWAGMVSAYARSSWIVGLVIFFAFLIIAPNGPLRALKALLALSVLAGLIWVSPIGERVVRNIPFIGSVGATTVAYRQRVAEESWRQIQQHPILGNPLVVKKLEDLRQGQGIIDLLNTYTNVAMFYGVIGFVLFVVFFLVALGFAYGSVPKLRHSNPDLSALGRCLVACSVGTLTMMATVGFGETFAQQSWILFGLTVAYGQLAQREEFTRRRRTSEHNTPVASVPR